MKIGTLVLLVISISIEVPAQKGDTKNKFVLVGKITGQDTGFIHLKYTNKEGGYINDSSRIQNGNFTFTGLINNPVAADLIGNMKSTSTNDFNVTEIFLEPAIMKITLRLNDFKHAKITGSRSQVEIETLEKKNSFQNEMEFLENEFTLVSDSIRTDRSNKILKDRRTSIREKLEPYYLTVRKNKIQFIATHPKSYVSAYLLQVYVSRLPLDSAKMFFNNFSYAIKNSSYGNAIAENLRTIEGGSPGTMAKDFATIDINGSSISLSDYKEKKYILLDFWATWCVPCRQNNPHLIELYNTYYPKGLEIISIANDDSRMDEWKKAISEDKIGIWRHVLQGVGSANDIGKKFGITPIPAKILIDKNGVIILRYEGNYDFLIEKKLAEIFNH